MDTSDARMQEGPAPERPPDRPLVFGGSWTLVRPVRMATRRRHRHRHWFRD